MKLIKKNSLPLKIRKSPSGSERINVFGNRTVFYNREVDVNSLNVDSSSSIHFNEAPPYRIDNLNVSSGKILLINRDCQILGNVIIENNSEMRII
jgi:hypothetical protein